MGAEPPDGGPAEAEAIEFERMGEGVALDERFVVAPSWGRVRLAPLQRGEDVAFGSTIAHLHDAGAIVPVIASVAGRFMAWLAQDGERVPPGRPLALLALPQE